jgi:hypothetical protein
MAELLRSNLLRPVYHGEQGVRTLKELARSYLTISKDLARVMSRLKAVYRRPPLQTPPSLPIPISHARIWSGFPPPQRSSFTPPLTPMAEKGRRIPNLLKKMGLRKPYRSRFRLKSLPDSSSLCVIEQKDFLF